MVAFARSGEVLRNGRCKMRASHVRTAQWRDSIEPSAAASYQTTNSPETLVGGFAGVAF
jgi:hypothetical protein